jgi:hypothetical protein
MPKTRTELTIADPGNAEPNSKIGTPIPEQTRKRRLKLQHAARLYIYEGVDSMRDLSKKSGVDPKYLRRVKGEDKWDDFAEHVWRERTASTLTIRTVEEQSLIDGEKERQHREVPKLQVEAERLIEAMAQAQPGSKLHAAILTSMKTVRGLLEGSTHYDLAKAEAAARMRLALTSPIATPSAHRPAVDEPEPEAGDALDLNNWEGVDDRLPIPAMQGAGGLEHHPQNNLDEVERERWREGEQGPVQPAAAEPAAGVQSGQAAGGAAAPADGNSMRGEGEDGVMRAQA